ncbi:hypothetical protein [Bacteroides neonati]|uniref:hypothetical protein n=1 Tax=Bacteroides neonati TaxID=1347393 RepID=UPI0005AA05F6|nr:hypothetical protein [Bacteroides neonati]
MRSIKRVLYPLLLLALFATYQVGITLFTHVHYVNGVMITHSHPSKEKHSHSKTELVVLDRLSVFQTLEADAPIHFKPILSLLAYIETPVRVPVATKAHLRVLSLRAPPYYSVS